MRESDLSQTKSTLPQNIRTKIKKPRTNLMIRGFDIKTWQCRTMHKDVRVSREHTDVRSDWPYALRVQVPQRPWMM